MVFLLSQVFLQYYLPFFKSYLRAEYTSPALLEPLKNCVNTQMVGVEGWYSSIQCFGPFCNLGGVTKT